MVANLGSWALGLGLAGAVVTLFAYVLGLRRPGSPWLSTANSLTAVLAALSSLAAAALVYLLLASDFSVQYVFEYTSSDLPWQYKLSAFWAGQAGSLLLWLWLHTLFAAWVTNSIQKEEQPLLPYVSAVLTAISVFFFVIVALLANPFQRMPRVMPEGMGLNPLLQNFGMVIHPVTLYLGYVGFAVPYAFALAGLLAGDERGAWLKPARRWALFAWMFLSIGLIYGGQWAYVELGWGGYWAWDPVENAALFPWLVGTAFFHSVMMQERRGMLKGWTTGLIIATYSLCVFGTFLTRSGLLQSVHAFPANPLMTVVFLSLILLVSGGGACLMATRRRLLAGAAEVEDYLTKEGTFLLNNLILAGATFAVVYGTMLPWLSKTFIGREISTGKAFFNSVTIPLALGLLVVLGLCTRLPWKLNGTAQNKKEQQGGVPADVLWSGAGALFLAAALFALGVRHPFALLALAVCAFVALNTFIQIGLEVRDRMARSGENPLSALGHLFVRQRRRMGAYVVHLAVVMMIVGFSGNAWNVEVQKTLHPGDQLSLGGYTMTFTGLREERAGRVTLVYAPVEVTYRGQAFGLLKPGISFHPDYANTGQGEKTSSEVAVKGNLLSDFYVILASWGAGGQDATFKVLVNYLVNWVWIGMWTLVLGTLMTLWPARWPS
ncbi:MAG: cytochrome c-type biogenesis CcmF C-terminal domain-containing protein [Bacillota bacterium]|nr:cytochrome c-type biogenesis CcmF C-terminal domain-containing protein [Bacillota bacterium]